MKQLIFIITLLVSFSCKKENNTSTITLTTNSFYEKAKQLQKAKASDSAFYYFNLAKNAFLTEEDSLGVARALVNMAIIQSDRGDYYGSIETSLEANKYIKKETDSIVKIVLASNYNNLGINSSNLKNYDNSILYYKKTLEYVNSEENKLVYYNNIGDLLIRKNRFKEAKKFLEKAIASKVDTNYARALNNLAKAKYLDDKNYNPLPELFEALEIRKAKKNSVGESSSYATLADYFYSKNKLASLMYAKMMLNKATQNKNFDDQLEALDKIIKLDPQNYLQNFIIFQNINNTVQTSRNENKKQFAVIRYDLESKNAENQKLRADNKIEKIKRNVGIGSLSILLITGFFWYKRRRKRLEQEKELEIKNTQLKMSKKVHDVVANGIYQVMTKIENLDQINKDEMLDELEFVYEKSRDISYEKPDSTNNKKDFNDEISELIGAFNNENVKTYLAGNDKNIWENLSETKQEDIYQIIRELLVNMKKHSQADRVVFRFEKENNLIKIYYTDNGIGISGQMIPKNGLSNTDSRIETLNGEIIFDTKIEKGLKIYISFPAS